MKDDKMYAAEDIAHGLAWRSALFIGAITALYLTYIGQPWSGMTVMMAVATYGLVALVMYGSLVLSGLVDNSNDAGTDATSAPRPSVEGFIARTGGWTRIQEESDQSIEETQ